MHAAHCLHDELSKAAGVVNGSIPLIQMMRPVPRCRFSRVVARSSVITDVNNTWNHLCDREKQAVDHKRVTCARKGTQKLRIKKYVKAKQI